MAEFQEDEMEVQPMTSAELLAEYLWHYFTLDDECVYHGFFDLPQSMYLDPTAYAANEDTEKNLLDMIEQFPTTHHNATSILRYLADACTCERCLVWSDVNDGEITDQEAKMIVDRLTNYREWQKQEDEGEETKVEDEKEEVHVEQD